MKCPRCGHWNKPSFPRCFKCGEPLSGRADRNPGWRAQFEEPPKAKKRVVYDDTVAPVEDLVPPDPPPRRAAKKPPEGLATEMTRLKDRRARGTVYLEEFRKNAAEQGIVPSGAGVSVRRSGYTIPDDPSVTVGGAMPDDAAYDVYDAMYDEAANSPDMQQPPPQAAKPRQRRKNAPASYHMEPAFTQADGTFNPYAIYDADLPPAPDAPGPIAPHKPKRRRIRGPILIAYLLVGVLVLALVSFVGYIVASYVLPTLATQGSSTDKVENYQMEQVTNDGLAAHRFKVAGDEGAQVYVVQMNKSYVVVDGYATFDVPDHVYYDTIDPLDQDTAYMDVELSMSMIKNNTQTRLEPIKYTIHIPETTVDLVAPESTEMVVNTSIYTIRMQVPPNSTVLINGNNESDKLDDEGLIRHNVSVQAIGNNVVSIIVRAPYCREKIISLTFYREPTEIPLELDPATLTNTTDEQLTIYGTTSPEATVTVESAYFELNTMLGSDTNGNAYFDGRFYVKAKMTRVGNNTVKIIASMPDKQDAILEHIVYYLPTADVYTPKAWALNASDYTELMNNINMRIQVAQIYLCQGTIKEILSENPQLAIMDTGKDGREQLVMLQNTTTKKWEAGKKYRVYADVSGVYTSMPRLMGRYSYSDEPVPEEGAEAAAAVSASPSPDAAASDAPVVTLGATDAPATQETP